MKTFIQRVNFSDKKEHSNAIKIDKWCNIRGFNQLSHYCAEYEIDTEDISNTDFEHVAALIEIHGQKDKTIDHYYFWIDND